MTRLDALRALLERPETLPPMERFIEWLRTIPTSIRRGMWVPKSPECDEARPER